MKQKLVIILAIIMVVNNLALYKKMRGRHETPVEEAPHSFFNFDSGDPESGQTEPEQTPPKVETIPIFVDVPTFRQSEQGSVYGDILSHSEEAPFGDQHGRATNAHETGHGIHSYLRNKYSQGGKRVNGFYCLNGRGAIVEEPRMTISQIREFIPQNLRADRYNLYFVQQAGSWNDTPLYIYDEWTAYVLGAQTNVDDVKNGRYHGGWTDGVAGAMEFSIYTIALCRAVKERDPDYWNSNEQFRKFTIWMLRQAREAYMAGRVMDQFKWDKQDKLYNDFLTSSEAEPLRQFAKEHLEGVWLDAQPVFDVEYKWYQRAPHSPEVGCSCGRHR